MLSTTTRTYSGRASAPNCLLAICSGIDAARPVVEEYFQDSDFCRGGGVPSPSGDGPLKSALNPACQETTCCFVDLGALKHGVLQRLLKAAAKNYFSLEELGTLRCSAVQRLLPPSSEWRWESDKQSEGSAVVVFLRRVSAVLCCARMAAGAGLVKPGPTSIPSNQPEFIFGHGVAMLARGAIPTEIERCLKAKPGPSARSGDGVQSQPVQASSCLMQTTCLAVLPTKVQNRDAEIQADAAIDPGSLADILRSVHDNGFQVCLTCPFSVWLRCRVTHAPDRPGAVHCH